MIASAAACVALITGLLASPSAAFHIPAASYSGPVSGGGSISFSVLGDGSSVTNLRLDGPIDGDFCTLNSAVYNRPTPIINHAFDNREVTGNFPGVQRAQGNLNISIGGGPFGGGCNIRQTWSAATSASPAGSEECKAAQAQVKKLKRALSKAKKSGNQAKIKQLQKKLKKAKNYRNQVCG